MQKDSKNILIAVRSLATPAEIASALALYDEFNKSSNNEISTLLYFGKSNINPILEQAVTLESYKFYQPRNYPNEIRLKVSDPQADVRSVRWSQDDGEVVIHLEFDRQVSEVTQQNTITKYKFQEIHLVGTTDIGEIENFAEFSKYTEYEKIIPVTLETSTNGGIEQNIDERIKRNAEQYNFVANLWYEGNSSGSVQVQKYNELELKWQDLFTLIQLYPGLNPYITGLGSIWPQTLKFELKDGSILHISADDKLDSKNQVYRSFPGFTVHITLNGEQGNGQNGNLSLIELPTKSLPVTTVTETTSEPENYEPLQPAP